MSVPSRPSVPNATLLEKLRPLREKLIDVSLRNRLLNYRDLGSQTVPLLRCDLDLLYESLVINEKALEIEGMPQRKGEDSSSGSSADEPVQRPKIDFSGEDATEDLADGRLKCRDSMLKTENRMTALYRKYKECLDAFGSNLCYMALGFLEWNDPKRESDEKIYAPLVLVPVALSRVKREVPLAMPDGDASGSGSRGRPRGGERTLETKVMAYRFTIRHDGEDIADNVALRLKLENLPDGMILPAFDSEADDVSVEDYLVQVEEMIKRLSSEVSKGWKVVRGARLAFFTSAKEAMYRDLDPDRWPKTGLVHREWIQAALDGRDADTTAGVTNEEITHALHVEPVPTVLETDGSQMRAIVRVLRGDPMVIQGPPGTGKSQTITNLIAATLAQGKSVLFVAEKMAALSVVRDRMVQTGLDQYCLELHSAKATPRQVVEQVKNRLSHIQPTAMPPAQAVSDRQRLNMHRVAMSNYGDSLQSEDGLEQSFFATVWERSRFLDALDEFLVDQNVSIESLPALSMRSEARHGDLTALTDALKVACRCYTEGVHLSSKPWTGTHPREVPGPGMESFVRQILATAKQEVLAWQLAEEQLPLPNEWPTLTAEEWLKLHQDFQPGAAPPLSEAMCHQLAADFSAVRKYEIYLQSMAAWRAPQRDEARGLAENSAIDNLAIEKAQAASIQLRQSLISRLPHQTLAELAQSTREVCWLRDTLEGRSATLRKLATVIHVPEPQETFAAGSRLAGLAGWVASLPPSVWRCLHPALLHPSSASQFNLVKARNEELVAERGVIAQEVRLDDLMETAKWRELAQQLRLTADGWFNWLPGTRGHGLRKELHACFLKCPQDEKTAIAAMDRAQQWRANAAVFAQSEDAKALLGPAFAGIETDWAVLGAAMMLITRWRDELGSPSAQEFVTKHTDAVHDQVSAIASLAAKAEADTEKWIALAAQLFRQDKATLQQLSTHTLKADVAAQSIAATGFLESLEAVRLPSNSPTHSVPELCSGALKLRAHAATVAHLTASPEFLGDWHQTMLSTDTLRTAESLAWLRKMVTAKNVPTAIKTWALSTTSAQRVLEICEGLHKIMEAIERWRSAMRPLTEVLVIESDTAPMSADHLERSVDAVLVDIKAATEALRFLMPWYHLHASEQEIEQAGGKSIWEWCRTNHLSVKAVETAAKLSSANQTLERILAQQPELKTYYRQKLEEHRHGFRTLDKSLLSNAQKEVDRSIYRRPAEAPAGLRRGSPKDYTGMAMLNHEMSKQARHVPVRRLVRQSGEALKFLMPCWMMGPQAVAQFLEPEEIEFDLLIIDEASQVRPEDALGSLARAKQIVIVGDSKQMPPTDVFQALGVQDGDEIEDEDGDMISVDSPALSLTSILDTFEKQLPAETLRWHYRSLHQSLIAFSNENFYDNELIVPPSRWHAGDSLGIVRHYLEHGRLQNRTNPVEAMKVVEMMREHVLREIERGVDDRETLGVVAMNAVQQDLISEKWEKACKDDPLLEAASIEFATKASLFIRNLENVQGDERDVIIISTTYAKNAAGEMHQRFGPVNKAGGWRRLNVLFTRARMRIHLVTSMLHSDVQPDRGKGESGRNFLHKYLQYAETGRLPDSGTTGFKTGPDSGFEESVSRCIRGLGYEFHYQVGVQGFFIDIGVVHPERPGQYLCGIECDGAAYHSHPIARDRDRIRQEILESRGWNIFRVWSTDWYRNRTDEVKRLHSYLQQRGLLP